MGIAVGTEQALAGGQHRTRAVAFDAAAFQNQARNADFAPAKCPSTGKVTGHLVVQVSGKFQPPGVEAEVEQHRAIVFHHRDRAEVPGPGVVSPHPVQADLLHVDPGLKELFPDRFDFRGNDQYPLEPADFSSNMDKDRFNGRQVVAPVAVRMRPGEQHPIVHFPLSR